MPILVVSNLTDSKLPLNSYIGVLGASKTVELDLSLNDLEESTSLLVALADRGLISYTVSSTPSSADDALEPVLRDTISGSGSVTLTGAGGAITWGTGTPEAAVVGNIGDLFIDTAGGTSTTLYVKEADAGLNTGWAAK